MLADIIKRLSQAVRPGVTTLELEELARKLIKKTGGKPSFLNYDNYPCVLCTSINEAVVHGIPKAGEIIKNGDIIGLDLGLWHQGWHTDMAVTVGVGRVSKIGRKLIKVANKALEIGIEEVRPGNFIGDVGSAIQRYVESQGFSVVRALIGHGLGKDLHEPPRVPNFGEPKTAEKLEPGMTLAIEPMICENGHQVKTASDGWTVLTMDGGLSAHFEHTVAVTEMGHEVLTK